MLACSSLRLTYSSNIRLSMATTKLLTTTIIVCLAVVGNANAVGEIFDDSKGMEVEESSQVSMEADLLKYLLMKKLLLTKPEGQEALKNQVLLMKRVYWKQCALNAVTCFGK